MRTLPFNVVRCSLVIALLVPAAALAETLVIDGATIHSMSGAPFVGRVVVEEGLIAAVGPSATAPAGATTIDATGKHVYPGIFDALSQLGLIEVGAVAATNDQAEMGTYNPHLDAATAIHPASEVIPVTRANGITHSLVAPRADRDGVIAGRATLVQLDGWTVEEMALQRSLAMVILWPAIVTRSFDFSTFSWKETPYNEAKEKATEKQNELRDWVEAARHYMQASQSQDSRAKRNLKLAALAACLDGNMPVIIQANAKRDIESAVEFAETEGLRLILAGGRDAWKVKEMLAEKQIPVILGRTQSLPREQDDPYDRPFGNPGELVAAGVKVSFGSGSGGGFGPGGAHSSRTLPYEAATAAAYGLSEEDAMRALTLWPAEIFGVADRLGSIEVGKIANLVVTSGTPLELTTQVEHVIIGGHEISTENRHHALYERYRARATR
ncbi:MAG: amidohydrolase family protein [Candidatus Latescibacterota bacterium]|nr:MAG: amidohydrolase family protein [Candidatus Latescibacterota bacterium]